MTGSIPRYPSPPGPGYHEQAAWGFRDQTEHLCCVFHRVYAPPDYRDTRGPTCQLEENLSYWSVTPIGLGVTPERGTVGWSLSYAQASRLHGGLTFQKFASVAEMREELPDLLSRHGHEPRSSSAPDSVSLAKEDAR